MSQIQDCIAEVVAKRLNLRRVKKDYDDVKEMHLQAHASVGFAEEELQKAEQELKQATESAVVASMNTTKLMIPVIPSTPPPKPDPEPTASEPTAPTAKPNSGPTPIKKK